MKLKLVKEARRTNFYLIILIKFKKKEPNFYIKIKKKMQFINIKT